MKKHLYIGLILLIIGGLSGCKTNNDDPIKPTNANTKSSSLSTYPLSLATDWQDLHLSLIKADPTYVPPVAARAIAYANLAFYEATVYGTENKSLAGQLNGLANLTVPNNQLEFNWGLAGNEAMAMMLKGLYPTTAAKNQIEAFRVKVESQLKGASTAEVITRSKDFGTSIAKEILAFAKSDGGDNGQNNLTNASYNIPKAVGFWEPQEGQKPLLPFWAKNRSMVQANVTSEPAKPYDFSFRMDTDFFREAKEVHDVGVSLSPAQREIALFWADGGGTVTPPGHHLNIATIIAKSRNSTLPVATELYAKLGLALNDAFIACWRVKYKYNLMRPITYIRTAISPSWKPLITTPPFPEYTSGHSTAAGAAYEVLKASFGEEVIFTDNTSASFAPRTYRTLTAYVNEASISRIYGGIHFRRACEQGMVHGKKIGQNVLALKFR